MLTAGEGQGRCLPMNDELLIPCFGGDTGTKNTQCPHIRTDDAYSLKDGFYMCSLHFTSLHCSSI